MVYERINYLFNLNNAKKEYLLAVKAIVIMKENWAKDINEIDKLDLNITSKNSYIDIKKENKTIAKLKEESRIQQEKDLIKAKQLSEKIKLWNNSNLDNEIRELVKWNSWAMTIISELKNIVTNNDLTKYIKYFKENNLFWAKLWELYSYELHEVIYLNMRYLNKKLRV